MINNKVGIILICASLFSSLFSNAQQHITLDEARSLVLKNSEKAKTALLEIEVAEENIKTAKTKFLPSVSASARGFGLTDNVGLALAPQYGGIGDITIEQPIYLGGKIRAGLYREQIAKQVSEYNKTLDDDDLLFRVEELYWNIVAAEQQIVVAENYMKSLSILEENVQNSYDAGLIDKTDLLEVQVAKNRAIYNLEVAKNFLGLIKLDFANIIDIDGVDFEVEKKFPPTSISTNFSNDIKNALNNRVELKLIKEAIKGKNVESIIIKSDFRPEVAMSIGAQAIVAEDNSPSMISGAAPALAFESEQVFGVALLNVSIPIFNWNQKKSRLKANELQNEQLVLQKSTAEKNISLQLLDAINKIDEAMLNLELSRKSEAQAIENLRILKDNFDVGRITSDDVLEGEALLQQSQLDVINASKQQQLNYTNYLRTIGTLSN